MSRKKWHNTYTKWCTNLSLSLLTIKYLKKKKEIPATREYIIQLSSPVSALHIPQSAFIQSKQQQDNYRL